MSTISQRNHYKEILNRGELLNIIKLLRSIRLISNPMLTKNY